MRNQKYYAIRQDFPFMRIPVDVDDWEKATGLHYNDEFKLDFIVSKWNEVNENSNEELVQCEICHKYSFWGGYEDDPTMWYCEKCNKIFCEQCCTTDSENTDGILCDECKQLRTEMSGKHGTY